MLKVLSSTAGAVIVVTLGCSSSPPAKTTPQTGQCQVDGAHLGCTCSGMGVACAAAIGQSPSIVECMNGKWTMSMLTCPNSKNCGSDFSYLQHTQNDFGTVDCGITAPDDATVALFFTLPGVPCLTEGELACVLGQNAIARCTNGAWANSTSCGAQQCGLNGHSVGCI